jgi:RNA recognition motif-containing protein
MYKGKTKGIAFVKVENMNTANSIVERFNGYILGGKKIKVELAKIPNKLQESLYFFKYYYFSFLTYKIGLSYGFYSGVRSRGRREMIGFRGGRGRIFFRGRGGGGRSLR